MRPVAALLAAAAVFAQADPAVQAGFGKVALENGNYAEAIRIYSDLVRKLPSNAGLRMNLGMAMSMAGQHREAVPVLEAAVQLDPKMPPAWLFLGSSYMELQEPAKAEPALRKFVGVDGNHPGSRLMLGDALMALDKPEDAVEHYKRLSELDPKNPEAWQGLGKAFELSGQRAFDEMQRMEPESAWALALVGEARWTQLELPSAYWLLREALKRKPDLRGIRPLIARIYRESGHEDWAKVEETRESKLPRPDCAKLALECNFRAGKIDAVWNDARYRRPVEAHYWMVKASHELSVRAYEKLLELPASAEIHTFLAETYRQQRRHVEEAAQWRAALRLDPSSAALRGELAIALHATRDYAGAERLERELLTANPESARLNFMLGDTLLAQQKATEAIGPLTKSVKLDRKFLPAQASLARALLAAGRGGEAVPYLEASLAEDHDGSLHFQLARAYQALGRVPESARAMAKYQEIRAKQSAEKRAAADEVRITGP